MSDPRVTACGKELLLDGAHLADCRDDAAAEVIAIALHRFAPAHIETADEARKLREFFA